MRERFLKENYKCQVLLGSSTDIEAQIVPQVGGLGNSYYLVPALDLCPSFSVERNWIE
jgi:hypothetical protein